MNRFTIALVFAIQVAGLRFMLDGKQPRISLMFLTGGKQSFYLVSSGKEEVNHVEVIISVNETIVFNKIDNEMEFHHQFPKGKANVTIISRDSSEKLISFDFQTDDDPLLNIIEKKDIKIIEEMLGQVHSSMQTISRNQQFHIERDEVHKETLEESQNHIKWTGIIKIVFLLSSALIQLWIMKSFFKNNGSNTYQPVETN